MLNYRAIISSPGSRDLQATPKFPPVVYNVTQTPLMELLCCNSLLFVRLLILILMCCVTEQQINKEELGTTTERGKWAVLRKHSMFLQSQEHREGVLGSVSHLVNPIHQNDKIFYFCLFLLLKKAVSVTAQEINDILGSIPSPCSHQSSKQTARH